MKQSLPDFKDFEQSSKYFYQESVALNDAVEDFIAENKHIPGLSTSKTAKLYSGLLNLVDQLFIMSGMFEDLSQTRLKKLNGNKNE